MESIRVKYEHGVFKLLEKTRGLREGPIGEVLVDEAHVEQTRTGPSVRLSEFLGLWNDLKDVNSSCA